MGEGVCQCVVVCECVCVRVCYCVNNEIIEDMDGKLGSPHVGLEGYDSKRRSVCGCGCVSVCFPMCQCVVLCVRVCYCVNNEIIEDMDGKLGSPHGCLEGYDSKRRSVCG